MFFVRTTLATRSRIQALVLWLASGLVDELFAERTGADGAIGRVVALVLASGSIGCTQVPRASAAFIGSSWTVVFAVAELMEWNASLWRVLTRHMFEGAFERELLRTLTTVAVRFVGTIATIVLPIAQPSVEDASSIVTLEMVLWTYANSALSLIRIVIAIELRIACKSYSVEISPCLHFHDAGIQIPLVAHRNWSDAQVVSLFWTQDSSSDPSSQSSSP